MRVVVTGAHGKVGRAAVKALAEAGHEVTATDLTRPVLVAELFVSRWLRLSAECRVLPVWGKASGGRRPICPHGLGVGHILKRTDSAT